MTQVGSCCPECGNALSITRSAYELSGGTVSVTLQVPPASGVTAAAPVRVYCGRCGWIRTESDPGIGP